MPFILWTEVITALFCLALGAFAFIRNPKSVAVKGFALLNLALALWTPTDFLKQIPDHQTVLAIYRLSYIGGSYIGFSLLMFIWGVLERRRAWGYQAVKGMAFVFAILSQTPLLIKDIQMNVQMSDPIIEVHGSLYWAFVAYFVGSLIYSLASLVLEYASSSGVRRKQIQYIVMAVILGFLSVIDFFANQANPNFPPLFYFGMMGISTIFAIAIMNHHLMDIGVIIRKTVIYSVVTAVLTAIYVVIAMGVARVLTGWVASPTAFSSVTAACAMALLFHPMRMKVQRFVDRHFFRESLDQAMLREATSGFVHEIKRPLAKISLPAELSLSDLRDVAAGRRASSEVLPKVIERLEFILNQTNDAGNKIEAIHEVSSSDVKAMEAVDLKNVIKSSLEREKELTDRHNVRVHLDLPESLPSIRGHAKQLEIVVSNLIKNAAEALSSMPPNAPRAIWVRASAEDDRITLSIKDSGPGIKPENIKRLFEPYFTTKGAHGTGMGLFLCRQIVEAHGGKIEVRTESGKGAELVIRMPSGSYS
jgi:signal transduction histidine kinase